MKKPAELNVPAEKFHEFFGEEWATVLAEERAFNALDLQAQLPGVDLLALWDKTNTEEKTRIKFGGGFYCAQLEVDGKKYYTFNL